MQTSVPTRLIFLTTVLTVLALSGCVQRTVVPMTTPTPTAAPSPTPGSDDTTVGSENWKTYVNDVYHYQFQYPPDAIIREAKRSAFGYPSEDRQAGLTVDQVYDKYTGKICIKISYQFGFITIAAPINGKTQNVVGCGLRTSGFGQAETVTVGKKLFQAQGSERTVPDPEDKGRENYLMFHHETYRVTLDDGTVIMYGSEADGMTYYNHTSTFTDYLGIKPDLLKIIETFTTNKKR